MFLHTTCLALTGMLFAIAIRVDAPPMPPAMAATKFKCEDFDFLVEVAPLGHRLIVSGRFFRDLDIVEKPAKDQPDEDGPDLEPVDRLFVLERKRDSHSSYGLFVFRRATPTYLKLRKSNTILEMKTRNSWDAIYPLLRSNPILIDALRNLNEEGRILAIKWLQKCDAIKELLVAVQDAQRDPSPLVRVGAIVVLAKWGQRNEAMEKILLKEIQNDDPYVRVSAIRALEQFPCDAAAVVPLLAERLKDKKDNIGESVERKAYAEEVRSAAAIAIARLGPKAKAAVPALIQALSDPENSPPIGMVEALGAVGPDARKAIPALLDTLKVHHNGLHQAVLESLGTIGVATPDVTRTLTSFAQDPKQGRLCYYAARALLKIDPKNAAIVTGLCVGLRHDFPSIRARSATLLGGLGVLAREALPLLRKAAEDDNIEVREAALKAIRSILSSN